MRVSLSVSGSWRLGLPARPAPGRAAARAWSPRLAGPGSGRPGPSERCDTGDAARAAPERDLGGRAGVCRWTRRYPAPAPGRARRQPGRRACRGPLPPAAARSSSVPGGPRGPSRPRTGARTSAAACGSPRASCSAAAAVRISALARSSSFSPARTAAARSAWPARTSACSIRDRVMPGGERQPQLRRRPNAEAPAGAAPHQSPANAHRRSPATAGLEAMPGPPAAVPPAQPSRSGAAVSGRTSADPAVVPRSASATEIQNLRGSRTWPSTGTHAACRARPASAIHDRTSSVFPLPASADI